MATEKRLIDLTGQRFGKLVVLEYDGTSKRRESLWRCACDCGTCLNHRRGESDGN